MEQRQSPSIFDKPVGNSRRRSTRSACVRDFLEKELEVAGACGAHIHEIVHISDLHVRRDSRVEEFDLVVERLCRKLSETPLEGKVVVVTGDVVHDNNQLSPGLVLRTLDYLTRLALLCPTFVIAGNHDAVVRNNSIVDSLTAILAKRCPPGLFYLRETGLYRFRNLVFGVASRVGEDRGCVPLVPTSPAVTRVALFHGSVEGARHLDGQESTVRGAVPLAAFEGYDMVLLGDFHGYHHPRGLAHVAYAGSLVMQNRNEVGVPHGYLRWSVKERRVLEHVPVQNDFEFCVLRFVGNSVEGEPLEARRLPPRGNLLVHFADCSEEFRRGVHEAISTKFRGVQVSETSSSVLDELPSTTFEEGPAALLRKLRENVLDFFKVEALSSDHFRDLSPETVLEEMLPLMDLFEGKGATETARWCVERLEFSNLLTYGEKQVLDFSALSRRSVCALIASNSTGKSSLIDVLTWVLYGSYARGNGDPNTICNVHKTEFEAKLVFRVGGVKYFVHRRGKKGGTKWKVSLNVRTDKEDLTQRCLSETQKKINEVTGSLDDFKYVSLCLQGGGERPLWEYKPSEKRGLLCRMMRLNVFDEVYPRVKVSLEEVERRVQEKRLLLREDHELVFADTKQELLRAEQVVGDLEERKKTLNRELESLTARLPDERLREELRLAKEKPLPPEQDVEAISRELAEAEAELVALVPRPFPTSEVERLVGPPPEGSEVSRLWEQVLAFRATSARCGPGRKKDLEKLRTTVKLLQDSGSSGKYEEALRNREVALEEFCGSLPTRATLEKLRFERSCGCCRDNEALVASTGPTALVSYVFHSLVAYRHRKASVKEVLQESLSAAEERELWVSKLREAEARLRECELQTKTYWRRREELTRRAEEEVARWRGEEKRASDLRLAVEKKRLDLTLAKRVNEERQELLGTVGRLEAKLQAKSWVSTEKALMLLRTQLATTEKSLDLARVEVGVARARLQQAERDLEKRRQAEEELVGLEKKRKVYAFMLKQVNPEGRGLPAYLLKRYCLPRLEEDVNRLASPFLKPGQRVSLEVGEDRTAKAKDILFKFRTPSGHEVSVIGGMEQLIYNLSVKVALGRMASVPKCSVFVVDEGFSVMDRNRRVNVSQFLDFLRCNFDHTILISHDDGVSDAADHTFTVEEGAGGSVLLGARA